PTTPAPSPPAPPPSAPSPGAAVPAPATLAQPPGPSEVSAAAAESASRSTPDTPLPSAAATETPAGVDTNAHSRPVTLGFRVSGYLQAQYENSQLSEDQLQQGGVPQNRDRFVLRRARLRVDHGWTYAAGSLEVDGNYASKASFSVRRAEASLLYRGPNGDNPLPFAALTLGVFETPFGYELMDSSRSRWFMERSTTSLALFPTEPDMGARLSGAVSFFRYAIAIVNGEPLDDRSGRSLSDPNAAKDIVGRFGVVTQPTEKLRVSGGTSFLHGKGFHPGSSATKDSTTWVDVNENGQVEQGEVNGIAGRAAVPSQNFSRWAFGADLQVRLRTSLGWSTLYGEGYVAKNLDRGLVVADPVATDLDASGSERTGDVRELGGYVAFVQDIGRYGVVGLRADVYDPNSDFLRQKQGKLLPASYNVTTLSPLLGVVLADQARLLFQYDFIKDHFGKDARGVPTDSKNDQWTLRLQVML
ncbi:MAG TPA: hypothetical protein VJT73_18145, partial [Polyangiaceae bacterium]|nr:hypothetical protein [Polyangiaceae bacterium]